MQIKCLMDENLPPIYQIQPMSLGETIEELVLAALTSLDDEYRDRISYLPLRFLVSVRSLIAFLGNRKNWQFVFP